MLNRKFRYSTAAPSGDWSATSKESSLHKCYSQFTIKFSLSDTSQCVNGFTIRLVRNFNYDLSPPWNFVHSLAWQTHIHNELHTLHILPQKNKITLFNILATNFIPKSVHKINYILKNTEATTNTMPNPTESKIPSTSVLISACFSLQTLKNLIQHPHLTYGVFVFVRVYASIHDSSKQVIHDAGQGLCVQHAMQCTNKHSFTGVQTLGRTAHIVAVRDHPRDHLHLEQEKEHVLRSYWFLILAAQRPPGAAVSFTSVKKWVNVRSENKRL